MMECGEATAYLNITGMLLNLLSLGKARSCAEQLVELYVEKRSNCMRHFASEISHGNLNRVYIQRLSGLSLIV